MRSSGDVQSKFNIASASKRGANRTCECRLKRFFFHWFDLFYHAPLRAPAIIAFQAALCTGIVAIISYSPLHFFAMASNYNLRNEKNTLGLGPREPTIPCLKPGCIRHFYNRTGRSNHIRSKHPHWQFVQDIQQQQANARTTSNSVPGQASSGDDDIPSSPSGHGSTVPVPVSSNSHGQSKGSGDESIDELGDNFNVDIAFDGGYEGDGRHSSGNQTREPSEASAPRSNNGAPSPSHDPILPVLPRLKRTHHPIINGRFVVLIVIHIYLIFRNNLR
jgi:hypothetical protein